MRILLYSHYFAPSVGGVETYMLSLAEGLAKGLPEVEDQIEVTVVTRIPEGGMDDAALPFSIVRQPSLLGLAKLINGSDVVHVAGPALAPMILATFLRKPTVIEHSGYQSICPNGMLLYGAERTLCPGHFMARRYGKCVSCNTSDLGRMRSIRGLLLTFPRRWLCQCASQNVAPSRHIAMRTALPRTAVIYHGVPRQDPAPGEAIDQSGDSVSFLYVGRLVMEKGVPVLLQAARRLAESALNFRIDIVGDGPERRNLEVLAHELHLNGRVKFHGAVPLAKIPEVIRRPSAVVMPSVWEDVAPLVTIEQMMLGRLVIASDIGGLGELLGDGGLKFPAGDSVTLAERMKQVLENPQLGESKRKEAKARALTEFQVDRMVRQHAELYVSLAKS